MGHMLMVVQEEEITGFLKEKHSGTTKFILSLF